MRVIKAINGTARWGRMNTRMDEALLQCIITRSYTQGGRACSYGRMLDQDEECVFMLMRGVYAAINIMEAMCGHNLPFRGRSQLQNMCRSGS